MKQTVIVYGSTTGTAEDLAGRIGVALGCDNVVNVCNLTADMVAANDNLVLGSSTWGAGEMQDDWYDGVRLLKDCDLTGKTVALWACGDSASYADTFCDAMAELKRELEGKGVKFVGQTPTDGYSFVSSASVEGNEFVGLALDEMNESDQTDERIAAWAARIKSEL